MNYEIDYKLLTFAKDFYNRKGFTYLEVPWIVNKKYANITAPKGKSFGVPVRQHLVASAEQAFLQLALTNKIYPNIRFQSISPCFRREEIDETHSQWFIKLELFEYFVNPVDPTLGIEFEKEYFIKQAKEFFGTLTDINKIFVIPTNDGKDIEINNIEIGSYGIRCYKNITWIYGTGLALPRFSYASNL